MTSIIYGQMRCIDGVSVIKIQTCRLKKYVLGKSDFRILLELSDPYGLGFIGCFPLLIVHTLNIREELIDSIFKTNKVTTELSVVLVS